MSCKEGTVYFTFQTRAPLRLKGVIIYKDARTPSVNQACPRAHGSPVNTPFRIQPETLLQQSLFKGLRAKRDSKMIDLDGDFCPNKPGSVTGKADNRQTGKDVSATAGAHKGFLVRRWESQDSSWAPEGCRVAEGMLQKAFRCQVSS